MMDVCKDAGSLSWFQNVQCGSINYVEYHNSEVITYSSKEDPDEAENNADDETILNVGSDSSDLGGIQTKDPFEENGMNSEGREELAEDEVELRGDGIKRESDEGEEREDDSAWPHHCGEERKTVDEIKEHNCSEHLSIFIEEEREVDSSESMKKMSHNCNFCEKNFKYKSQLIRHLKVHEGKKSVKHVSSVCKTLHSQNINDHFCGYGEDRYDCQYCDYSCTQERQLLEHVRKHTGVKPFKCQHCELSFCKKSHLQGHMRKHTGEKPFKCQSCKLSFSHKYTLQRHTRKHTGEKPFECQNCGLSFSHKCTLQAHMRRHTGEKPFKCQYCELSFSQRSTLQAHTRRHTGERPFLCQLCGLGFSQKSALQAHMRVHTGERPFLCELCGLDFSEKSSLKVHMRKHAGERLSKSQH